MNTALSLASHSLEIPTPGNAAPEWVQVLPSGRFMGRDGRGPYTADPARVMAATLAFLAGADLPFDYEHQMERAAENGKPAPASGWAKEFAAREDGLWARVEWTAAARAALAAREYRYLSPVFYHTKAGEVTRLESVALTNLPNLSMKALSARDGEHLKENHMTLAELLQQLFGLPKTADDAVIAAHARQVLADAETAKAAQSAAKTELDALKTEIGTALGVPVGENLAKAAQQTAVAAKAGAPDPAKFVPIEAHNATVAELATLKAAQSQAKATALVDDAKKSGKISPAMESWAKDYASQNPQGFADYVAKAPVIAATEPAATHAQRGQGEQKTLDTVEKTVCAAMGISAEDYAKSKQATEGAR